MLHTPSPILFHMFFWLLQVCPRILLLFYLLSQAQVPFCGSPILRRGLVLSSLWWAHGLHWLILSQYAQPFRCDEVLLFAPSQVQCHQFLLTQEALGLIAPDALRHTYYPLAGLYKVSSIPVVDAPSPAGWLCSPSGPHRGSWMVTIGV